MLRKIFGLALGLMTAVGCAEGTVSDETSELNEVSSADQAIWGGTTPSSMPGQKVPLIYFSNGSRANSYLIHKNVIITTATSLPTNTDGDTINVKVVVHNGSNWTCLSNTDGSRPTASKPEAACSSFGKAKVRIDNRWVSNGRTSKYDIAALIPVTQKYNWNLASSASNVGPIGLAPVQIGVGNSIGGGAWDAAVAYGFANGGNWRSPGASIALRQGIFNVEYFENDALETRLKGEQDYYCKGDEGGPVLPYISGRGLGYAFGLYTKYRAAYGGECTDPGTAQRVVNIAPSFGWLQTTLFGNRICRYRYDEYLGPAYSCGDQIDGTPMPGPSIPAS